MSTHNNNDNIDNSNKTPGRPPPGVGRPRAAGLLLAVARGCCKTAEWDEALRHARELDRIQPSAEAVDLIMDCLYYLGDRDGAEQMTPVVLARGGPHARNLLSVHMLKNRQLAHGFALRHELRQTLGSRGHGARQDANIAWWDGNRFDGTLLVIAEQALGEEILAAGAWGEIVRRGQDTVVECDKRLIPLFQRSLPELRYVPRFSNELSANVAPGCRKTTASELEHILRTSDEVRNAPNWLLADPGKRAALREKYRQQWPGQALIGISWRSFRAVWGSLYKTRALTDLRATLEIPGTRFVSLQYGPVADDLAQADAAGLPTPFVDQTIDPVADIDTLAAQVAAMDIVVTTSNTTAHMAGALGVPTLLMLPTRRGVLPYWCYDGDRTPWYPSIYMVRGDNNPETFDARVAAALTQMLKQVSGS